MLRIFIAAALLSTAAQADDQLTKDFTDRVAAECRKIVGEVHDLDDAQRLNDCQIAMLSRKLRELKSQQMEDAYSRANK